MTITILIEVSLTIFAVKDNIVDCGVTDKSGESSLYDDLTTIQRGWYSDFSKMPLVGGCDAAGPKGTAGDDVRVQQVNIDTVGASTAGSVVELDNKETKRLIKNNILFASWLILSLS